MDVDWLHKIPRIEVEEILKDVLEHTQDVEKYPAHIRPYYPLSGGYGRVIEAIAADINKFIKFNTAVKKLHYDEKEKEWIVNEEFKAKNVITTIPWPDLFEAMGKPVEIKEQISKIKYNKLVISLFETDKTRRHIIGVIFLTRNSSITASFLFLILPKTVRITVLLRKQTPIVLMRTA